MLPINVVQYVDRFKASPLRSAVCAAHRCAEAALILPLCDSLVSNAGGLASSAAEHVLAQTHASRLIMHLRGASGVAMKRANLDVAALMREFSLNSDEGVALMCLAEALLRIPDDATRTALIRDKLVRGNWQHHLGQSPSLFVNAAAWGLLMSGKLITPRSEQGWFDALNRLLVKGGEPLLRAAFDVAVRLLGRQFVAGETIQTALKHAAPQEARGYRYSYDMLGEAALTQQQSQQYFDAYANALHAIGASVAQQERSMDRSIGQPIEQRPGISIKLSALHPRYTPSQHQRVMQELLPRLKTLVQLAASYRLGVNLDAEESERLELSLDLFEALVLDPQLQGWQGLGCVVQAYQKRASAVVDWLLDLAQRSGQRLMIRLVKGAYWDSEIKRAQVEGQSDYPVFTRKAHTDVSYLACAEKLLCAGDAIYPQFATHNALTLCTVQRMAQRLQRAPQQYEFQCLHGMGEALYDQLLNPPTGQPSAQSDRSPAVHDLHCRIYAPVGSHVTLLPYLVRRLLENGANNSFVHQLVDETLSLQTLLADPIALTRQTQEQQLGQLSRQRPGQSHPAIPLPAALYAPRENSTGLDLSNSATLAEIQHALQHHAQQQWQASPILAPRSEFDAVATATATSAPLPLVVQNPAWPGDHVGTVVEVTQADVDAALRSAAAAQRPSHKQFHNPLQRAWRSTPPHQRAEALRQWAALLHGHQTELWALCQREAGKTLPNAVGEVREAIDFCRYYAQQLEALVQQGTLGMPLGVAVCISPWNFPLAIFVGQIAAALAAGNAVLAKPAEQTPLIAARAVELAHRAGIPPAALQLLPGQGDTVGQWLIDAAAHSTAPVPINAVLFTGSTVVAQRIHRALAQSPEDIVLIAETGGQNAMIVDSSALLEQVVQDVLASAFDSAGQRCSALRVLCIQHEIADALIGLLKGAMNELTLGIPTQFSTDIGPVIDHAAQQAIEAHITALRQQGFPVFQSALHTSVVAAREGNYVAPTLIEIPHPSLLTQEIFGPVLHIVRYHRDALPQLLHDINVSGYGLTFGVHSRINETIDLCVQTIHAGNIYVNRNLIGAVVGVQPFGGTGLSGTGPKAGGPLYLPRLMCLDAQQHAQLNHRSHVPQALPGPTGETNHWSLHPRGNIGCAAATPTESLQLIQWITKTGNHPVIDSDTAIQLQTTFPQQWPMVQPQVSITPLLHQADITAVVTATTVQHHSTLRQTLAARDGALLPLIIFDLHQPYAQQPLWRLYTEKTVSVNTTAAGGNAGLMALE